MPLVRLALQPGIDKQNTEYGAEGGWVDGDYIRFRYGLPEKLGGWTLFNAGLSPYFIGMISEIFTWRGLDGTPLMIIGTTRKLYLYSNGYWADVTPIRKSSTAVTFTTESGENRVIVNDPAHGCLVGDFVTFSDTSGNPGGIPNADLDNEFEVKEILTSGSYSILSPTAASSTATADGTADADYQISVGSDVSYFEYGWGVGTWGLDTWGTPRPATVTGITLASRVWQFDSYGEDVICQIINGKTFYYDASQPFGTRVALLSGAPTASAYAIVSTPDRHLVCLGTETTLGDPASQDPMFVRFSSQENLTQFQESVTNTAGGQRLTDGSKIITAVRSRGQILIFTDTSLHGMQYVGPPFTFGFQQLGANCGCLGPHAAVDVNGLSFWMGPEAFYVFDGTVKKLPCTVQDFVFKDINLVQGTKVHVGINSQFNEVTWWYCSAGQDFIDRFVTLNYLENVWSVGSLSRTSWNDIGTFPKPTASEYLPDSNDPPLTTIYGLTAGRSRVYNHEDGLNGNGQPINAYIRSGYFDIADGDNMVFMKRFIPDFKDQTGNLVVRLLLRAYPQADPTPSSLDPYTITPTTQKVDTRARGRQISLSVESNDLNTNWRFGTLRVDLQPDGLR
jgi:hypothetical protein